MSCLLRHTKPSIDFSNITYRYGMAFLSNLLKIKFDALAVLTVTLSQ